MKNDSIRSNLPLRNLRPRPAPRMLPDVQTASGRARQAASAEPSGALVQQLVEAGRPLYRAGRTGLWASRFATAVAMGCLASGMLHSSVGGLSSFGWGLVAASTAALAGLGARRLAQSYAWGRSQAFRASYEAVHQAGRLDRTVARQLCAMPEFGRVLALQQLLGGADTRLGWRLRAGGRNDHHSAQEAQADSRS